MQFRIVVLIFVVLVLFANSAMAAISAAEAVDFVESENNFLKQNDRVESPNVLIEHQDKKYWMVPLLAGEGAVTFFPVSFADKTLSENEAINSQLFSTAKFLRDYLEYRNSIALQNKRWFMGRDNELIIGDLSFELESEVFELNLIKEELSVPISVSGIMDMQESLSQMSSLAAELSQKISTASGAEASFTVDPTTSDITNIQDSFDDAFIVLFALEQEARVYSELVSNLKSVISSDDDLSVSEKNQFVTLADAPPALFTIGSTSIGNWVIIAQETQQQITQLLNGAQSKVFLDGAKLELERRKQQNQAFSAIYAVDEDFSDKTDYPSLQVAMNDLQSPTKMDFWENQSQLAIAIEKYANAVRFLGNEEFDLSLIETQKTKNAVELVVQDGLIGNELPPFDYSMIINILIIILILVIVMFALKNRQQLTGTVISKPEGEEIDVYGWQKK
ncbi:hypothetical protein KKE06_04175 [Candidatus Micrarchaeota archaeon]|nr:hypothetical protein [Candidatus Micrarchaeota archaeon]MBU1930282.1 hypothetical protein [Candidatus Micrarchaeota archaeon]